MTYFGQRHVGKKNSVLVLSSGLKRTRMFSFTLSWLCYHQKLSHWSQENDERFVTASSAAARSSATPTHTDLCLETELLTQAQPRWTNHTAPQSTKTPAVINDFYFKPHNFGVLCYIAIPNWYTITSLHWLPISPSWPIFWDIYWLPAPPRHPRHPEVRYLDSVWMRGPLFSSLQGCWRKYQMPCLICISNKNWIFFSLSIHWTIFVKIYLKFIFNWAHCIFIC